MYFSHTRERSRREGGYTDYTTEVDRNPTNLHQAEHKVRNYYKAQSASHSGHKIASDKLFSGDLDANMQCSSGGRPDTPTTDSAINMSHCSSSGSEFEDDILHQSKCSTYGSESIRGHDVCPPPNDYQNDYRVGREIELEIVIPPRERLVLHV